MIAEDYKENYITGWVKIYRSFINWEWYHDSKTVHLFLHLLLKANRKDKRWQGRDVKRGQLITGLNSLHKETGISKQSIRTRLEYLKKSGEVTIKSTHKNSLVTICNYDTYQEDPLRANTQSNTQLTHDQHTANTQVTTNKKEKKDKKEKNIPAYEEFLKYAREKKIDVSSEAVKFKYEAWVENDWRDGNDKPINKWKLKLLQTLPYMKSSPSLKRPSH